MKKVLAVVLAVVAMAAFGDYKVINLANGTNDVHISGAVCPIAIEVKSTSSNAAVRVVRASDVDIFRTVSDVITNDVSWDEMVITTNDCYQLSRNGLIYLKDKRDPKGSFSTPCSAVITDCGGKIIWNGACITNLMSVAEYDYMEGCAFDAISACYGNGVYVENSTDNIRWTGDFAVLHSVFTETQYPTNFIALAFGNGRFVMTFKDGFSSSVPTYGYATSENGRDWVFKKDNIGSRIQFCGGRFFASADTDSGTVGVMTSTDGRSWSKVYDKPFLSVAFGNGVFLAVTSDGRFVTSANGLEWGYCRGEIDAPREAGIAFRDDLKLFIVGIVPEDANSSFFAFYTTYNGGEFKKMQGLSSEGPWTLTGGVLFLNASAITQYGEEYSMKLVSKLDEKILLDNRSEQDDNTSWSGLTPYGGTVKLRHFYLDGKEVPTRNYWSLTDGYVFGFPLNDIDYRDLMPKKVEFGFPNEDVQATVDIVYSRDTNYIHHTEYEYVTNRIYKVLDHQVQKVVEIVSAQCVEGISSQAVTNRIFVINNDRLVVTGIVKDETESTDAVLICE